MVRERENELPADYQPCGTCGYDHEYEYSLASVEINRKHREAKDLPPDWEDE